MTAPSTTSKAKLATAEFAPKHRRRKIQTASKREMLDAFYKSVAAGELDLFSAIKAMRKITGLTQEDFAKHRGISVQALRQIESGKGNPTVHSINTIASAFGLEVGLVPKKRIKADTLDQ